MTLPVSLRDEAQAELEESHDFYEGRQPGLGVRFAAEVWDRLDVVAADPKRFAVVHRKVREADVPGWPFCLYYTVEPTRIRVVSVFHTSRDPRIWQRRRGP